MSGKNDAPLTVVNVVLDDDGLQRRRPPQGVWKWPTRIYVPCPVNVKQEFVRVSRANDMSQAELGLVIIQNAMNATEATQQVINEYRRDGKAYDRYGQSR